MQWIGYASLYVAEHDHQLPQNLRIIDFTSNYDIIEAFKNDLFLELANFIDNNGYIDYFYKKEIIYLEYDEHVYWHMENIINRCLPRNTYSQRKIDERLPNI